MTLILFKALSNKTVNSWILRAIFLSPLGPWNTPYILAITANKTWDVHILEVALSLFICCSLVCNAILNAGFPSESLETPIILPGIDLLYSSLVAKKAAWGPP